MRSAARSNYKPMVRQRSIMAGFTQIELMISIAIISIFFLALVGGFGPIAKGVLISKARSLGTNIAQEQIEKLKSLSYYRLMVTTSPGMYSDPAVPYDTTYYPSGTVQAGDMTFTRLTYVQKAQEVSGVIQTLTPTTPDAGLKLVTITVVWGAGGEANSVSMTNLLSNPNVIMTNSVFEGTVSNAATMNPVENAQVNVAENAGWICLTDASGDYELSVLPGSYNLVVRAQGYFTKTENASVASGSTITQDFTLTKMSSGTLTGTVWRNDHVVFSQVVGSSVCAATGFIQAYVELFNPTTSMFTMNTFEAAFGSIPVHDLYYQSESDAASRVLALDYYRSEILPSGYYLIANTTTITAGGRTLESDATFKTADPQYPNIIKNPDAGGFGIAPRGTQEWIDRFGWDRNSGSKHAPIYETEGLDETIGLEVGEQYVRLSSPAGVVSGKGNCYDSNNNNVDFVRGVTGSFTAPHNSSYTAVIVAGEPVFGAAMTVDDGLSSGTSTYAYGSPPSPLFVLPSVATGTWTCIVCGNGLIQRIENVAVSGPGTISIPNASTTPSWPAAGYPSVFLSSAAEQGYVSGRVTNVAGGVITSPYITVSDGFNAVSTDANGNYFLQTSSGIYTITANPNMANSLYVTQSRIGVIVMLGAITSGINFILSEGGAIRGFVTRDGINPLPNVLFLAEDSNGASLGEEVSGSDGYFTLVNLSTGTYWVYPILDSGEASSPNSVNVVLGTAGDTVFSSTFTISGAFGFVSGEVSEIGKTISSGVLVVVTTSTFSGTPPAMPAISSATLTSAPLYIGSSGESGTFSVEVRGSTSTAYNVYAFYPQKTGSTINLKYNVVGSQYVTAGSSTPVNFTTWLP